MRTITDGQIAALQAEADEVGDREQVKLCEVALLGRGIEARRAREACARAIAAASAQEESDAAARGCDERA